MPYMLKKISVHNSRVTAQALAESGNVTSASEDEIDEPVATHCNCNGRMGQCPLDGDCHFL